MKLPKSRTGVEPRTGIHTLGLIKPRTGVEPRTGLHYFRMEKAEDRPRAEDRCVCPASAANTQKRGSEVA